MGIKFANNASAVVSTSINTVGTTLTTGDNRDFPTLQSGEYFYATIVNSSGAVAEIVKVTAITISSSAGSFTIERAQEGTNAVNIASGAKIELRITAKALDSIAEETEKRVMQNLPYKSAEDLGTGWVTVAILKGPAQNYFLEYVITANKGGYHSNVRLGIAKKGRDISAYLLGSNHTTHHSTGESQALLSKVRILWQTGTDGSFAGEDYGETLIQAYNTTADTDVHVTAIPIVGNNHPVVFGAQESHTQYQFDSDHLTLTPTTTTPTAESLYGDWVTFWETEVEDEQFALTGNAVIDGKVQSSELVVRGEDADASPLIKFTQDATEKASIKYKDNNALTDDLEIKSSGGIKFFVSDTNNAFSIDNQGDLSFGTSTLATQTYVDDEVADLRGTSSSFNLDTLQKINNALNSDVNFYTSMISLLNTRLSVSGGTVTGTLMVSNTSPKFTLKDTSVADDHEINFTDNANAEIYQINTAGDHLNINTSSGKGFKVISDGSDSFTISSAGSASFANTLTVSGSATICSDGGNTTTNIASGTNTSSADTKTVNIGTGFTNGGLTTINIGTGGTTTTNTNIRGKAFFYDDIGSAAQSTTIGGQFHVDGLAHFKNYVEFNSNVGGTSTYDQLVSFKSKSGTTTWAEAGRIAVKGLTSAPANFVIGMDKAALKYFDGFGSRNIVPADADTANGTDAICDLGTYYNRFRIGKFSSGTSTTSDAREKRNIEELNEAELRVATRCKSLLRKYQRTEALELKGDDARLHFGIIAQDLEQAFADEGLDAHRYAMFLEDTWYVTEDGETFPVLEAVPEELRESAVQKSLKGIRYEQLLAFIIASI